MIPVLGGPEEGLLSWIEADRSTTPHHSLDAGAREPPYEFGPLIDSADTNWRSPAWLFGLILAVMASLTQAG